MKTQITKFKRFFDLDKEIAYINEMNKQGWKLVYIKVGCFYTFVKTEPDEYVTMLHAAKKEKVSEIMAFAARCGYESIPHTADGVGDLIYLTGKKSEVSPEFVSDNEAKLEVNKIILKKFNIFSILYSVMLAVVVMTFFMFALVIGFVTIISKDYSLLITEIIPMSILLALIVICIIRLIEVLKIRSKISKRVQGLSDELKIYE